MDRNWTTRRKKHVKASTGQGSTIIDSGVKDRRYALDPFLTRYSKFAIAKIPELMEGTNIDGSCLRSRPTALSLRLIRASYSFARGPICAASAPSYQG